MYYRNASAAIVCFDITNEDSFTKMKDWVEELKQNVPPEQLIIAIACTKSDLESERVIARSRAEGFAKRVDAILYETSAKDNVGVDEIFKNISEQVLLCLLFLFLVVFLHFLHILLHLGRLFIRWEITCLEKEDRYEAVS